MPLNEDIRNSVHAYCVRDLPGDLVWHIAQFSFVTDIELKNRLGRAYYSARYIAKLMEALEAKGDEIHSFVKFQIIQYASIYEAVISYLLWGVYKENPEVQKMQTHMAYKPVDALASLTSIDHNGEKIFTCIHRPSKTNKSSISFKDKVDCAVRIGFVDSSFSDDIKRTFELRNLTHIENEAQRQIEVEIEQSRMGYWRIKPFLEKIISTLKLETKS